LFLVRKLWAAMTPIRQSFVDLALLLSTALLATHGALAESHTVSFNNKCGFGTPMLIQGPNTLSTGASYTSNGPLSSAIAYLQTGKCSFNGEQCLLAELTLNNPNPNIAGSGSSVDISMIQPHQFSVATSFEYTNGCNGVGAACNDPSCKMAFRAPDDNQVQVACQANNVNLVITFCGDNATPASSPAPANPPPPPAATTKKPSTSSSPKVAPTSTPVRQPSCHSKRRRLARSGTF